MTTWDDVLSREIPCRRCSGTFRVRGPIAASDLAEIRTLLEAGMGISAVLTIREKTGAGLRDAKGMYEHVTIFRGKCRQCGKDLMDGVLSDCDGCDALNIDA